MVPAEPNGRTTQGTQHGTAGCKKRSQITIKKEDLNLPGPLIFDIGCHTGEDSDFYLRKGFTVVAVEANPALCVRLKQRFASQISERRFFLIEKAIAESAGEVTFFINVDSTIWGTIREDWARRNARRGAKSEKITVPSIRFSSLIEEFGVPYYLKIDIEGADSLCLDGLSHFERRPRFVSFEIEHWSLLRKEMNILTKLGYKKFKIVNQGLVREQVPPRPAREGIYVDYRFEDDASGLFGNELEDDWTTRDAAIAQLYLLIGRKIVTGAAKRFPVANRFAPRYSSWYDMHAALPLERD
jgi:FkbM family methyltransferase